MTTIPVEEYEDDAFGNPLVRRSTWLDRLEAIPAWGLGNLGLAGVGDAGNGALRRSGCWECGDGLKRSLPGSASSKPRPSCAPDCCAVSAANSLSRALSWSIWDCWSFCRRRDS